MHPEEEDCGQNIGRWWVDEPSEPPAASSGKGKAAPRASREAKAPSADAAAAKELRRKQLLAELAELDSD